MEGRGHGAGPGLGLAGHSHPRPAPLLAGGRGLTRAALAVRRALEAPVAGALEGPNDVDTVAVGTQAVTQGTLVDICGGERVARGARCERMADMDPSAIYRPLRHWDTRAHQWSHTRANTLARNTLFLNKHTPTLRPPRRLTHAPYMHRLACCRRTSAPTCWFTDAHTHTLTITDTHIHTMCTPTDSQTPATHTCLCVNAHPAAGSDPHTNTPSDPFTCKHPHPGANTYSHLDTHFSQAHAGPQIDTNHTLTLV